MKNLDEQYEILKRRSDCLARIKELLTRETTAKNNLISIQADLDRENSMLLELERKANAV